MKKILSLIIFGFLIFSFNTNITSVWAEATDVTTEVQQEMPQELPEASLQTDDVLDKPIFDDAQKQTNKNNITGKISSFIIKILGIILLAFVAIICLLFIVIANKQRQAEKRRKKMSANANIINAVDNFAHHRIKD